METSPDPPRRRALDVDWSRIEAPVHLVDCRRTCRHRRENAAGGARHRRRLQVERRPAPPTGPYCPELGLTIRHCAQSSVLDGGALQRAPIGVVAHFYVSL